MSPLLEVTGKIQIITPLDRRFRSCPLAFLRFGIVSGVVVFFGHVRFLVLSYVLPAPWPSFYFCCVWRRLPAIAVTRSRYPSNYNDKLSQDRNASCDFRHDTEITARLSPIYAVLPRWPPFYSDGRRITAFTVVSLRLPFNCRRIDYRPHLTDMSPYAFSIFPRCLVTEQDSNTENDCL